MTQYPGKIFTPRPQENRSGVVFDPTKKTILYAEDVNAANNEIVATQTELGTNPKGAFASVGAFLSYLLSKIKNFLNDLDDVEIVAPADNEVLTFEALTNQWKNKPPAGGGGGGLPGYNLFAYPAILRMESSLSYGGLIRGGTQDADHIYIGGEVIFTIRQYRKSDLAFVRESSIYTGGIQFLALDGNKIYAVGSERNVVRFIITNIVRAEKI